MLSRSRRAAAGGVSSVARPERRGRGPWRLFWGGAARAVGGDGPGRGRGFRVEEEQDRRDLAAFAQDGGRGGGRFDRALEDEERLGGGEGGGGGGGEGGGGE